MRRQKYRSFGTAATAAAVTACYRQDNRDVRKIRSRPVISSVYVLLIIMLFVYMLCREILVTMKSHGEIALCQLGDLHC